jgi:hypothetical protein
MKKAIRFPLALNRSKAQPCAAQPLITWRMPTNAMQACIKGGTMADDKQPVTITGIGTHQIDIEVLDNDVRDRLMDCIRQNGKVSIMVGHGQAAGIRSNGFAQQID